jgi:sulfonate transport system substrate-binding protein
VISTEQIKRQAKAFADLGVIQKDVSGQIEANWDGSFVDRALGR